MNQSPYAPTNAVDLYWRLHDAEVPRQGQDILFVPMLHGMPVANPESGWLTADAYISNWREVYPVDVYEVWWMPLPSTPNRPLCEYEHCEEYALVHCTVCAHHLTHPAITDLSDGALRPFPATHSYNPEVNHE